MIPESLKLLHWSIYVLSLASGVIMAGFMMMVPLLPGYAEQLGFNEFIIGMLVAAFFIGRVISQFPLGILSDHIGRKKVMVGSLLLFTVATAGFALTTGSSPMIALRVMQGVASAGFVVGFQAYVNDRTPTHLRGLAHGINSSAINAGVIVGPLLGGILSQRYEMTTPFWTGAALGGVCFFLSLTIPPVSDHKPFSGWRSLVPQGDKIRGLISSVLNFPALSLSLVHFLQMMSLAIMLTAAPLITAELLSWNATDIAVAMGLSGAAAVITSPFLGRLSDRKGSRLLVMAGGLCFMAFEALMIFFHPGTALTYAGFIIGGAGTPAYFNSFFSLIGDMTLQEERGAVSGFIGSFAEWGSIIGSSLLVPLLWLNFSLDTPMGVNFLILMGTAGLALLLNRPLKRYFREDNQ
ncbi:bacillibactin exporter [bacterium BMS3Abin01]|nr:bacillibactin exporter [bacterium BMS3Abin01]